MLAVQASHEPRLPCGQRIWAERRTGPVRDATFFWTRRNVGFTTTRCHPRGHRNPVDGL